MLDTQALDALIHLLESAQRALLGLLAWLGLASPSHGQPGWPFAWRLSGENLAIDGGQARRLAWTLLVLAVAAGALLLAMVWRRGRWYGLALLPLLLWLAPWPDAAVVLVPAHPTSFHRSPTGFSATAISQGSALYAQHCVGCHGADGRGGALAASQGTWPPNLGGPLLWRRADGDLLWHVLHGMRDRHGAATMPAFAQLGEREAWALIDYMKANAAGQSLRASGAWARPIGLPDLTVRCEGRPPRTLASWRGQRLRIVAADPATPVPLEDPRLVTVLLRPAADGTPETGAACVAESDDAWQAFALIAGAERLAGTQLIADRGGWVRARSAPGHAGWSEDDLLCRSESPVRTASSAPAAADGLGALIARIDAEPVRFLKGGFVH